MTPYTIKRGTIPLMQTRKTPVWKIAFSLGISGLLMLAALGIGWQQIS